jgi:hypothetical protein
MASIMSIGHRRCSALLRYLIFDVADVRLEWRQPTHVDQPFVSAAINIAGGVFAAVADDNLTDQLDVFALHDRHLFRKALARLGGAINDWRAAKYDRIACNIHQH